MAPFFPRTVTPPKKDRVPLILLEKRMRRIMGHQQLWILELKSQDQNQE
jgi:hypothetical protein